MHVLMNGNEERFMEYLFWLRECTRIVRFYIHVDCFSYRAFTFIPTLEQYIQLVLFDWHIQEGHKILYIL